MTDMSRCKTTLAVLDDFDTSTEDRCFGSARELARLNARDLFHDARLAREMEAKLSKAIDTLQHAERLLGAAGLARDEIGAFLLSLRDAGHQDDSGKGEHQ